MFLMVLIFITLYNNSRSEESDTLWTRELGGNGKGNIINAIFSPDDNSIFVTTTERFYEVNTLNGTVIREIPEIRGAKYLSSDGRFAYTYDLKKVDMLTKLAMGEFKSPLLPWYYYDFDVCENANMYVGIVKHAIQFPFPDSTIGIFDTQTFQLKKIIQLPKNYMEKVAISPDGKFIATNSLYEPNVQIEGDEVFITTIWDGTTYEKIKQLQLGGSNLLKFSPDGKYLGVGGGTKIYLYDTENWQLVDTYTIDGFLLNSFTFSNDSKYIFLTKPGFETHLYQINPKILIRTFPPQKGSQDIIISNNNKFLISLSGYDVYLLKNSITSVNAHIEILNFQITPNPIKNLMEITGNIPLINEIQIYDLKGNLSFSRNNESGNETNLVLDLTTLNNGVYILVLKTIEKDFSIKFIKE
jgi:WD40 repeat protein